MERGLNQELVFKRYLVNRVNVNTPSENHEDDFNDPMSQFALTMSLLFSGTPLSDIEHDTIGGALFDMERNFEQGVIQFITGGGCVPLNYN